MKVDRDLSSSFFKKVYIYDEFVHEPQGNIVLTKKVEGRGNVDPVWAEVDILVQQQHIPQSSIEDLLAALQEAIVQADWLEREYPTGQKLFK